MPFSLYATAGKHLGRRSRAGGVPAVMFELLKAGKLNGDVLTVAGTTIAENAREAIDRDVIKPFENPMMEKAGFLNMTGNLFESAIMKTSVIDDDFRARFLSNQNDPNAFEGKACVFEGSEDYHKRVNDPDLGMEETSILVMRYAGPIGWPGAAEVVNIQPSDELLKRGIQSLPTIGDGRQSGTSGSPSILNASPEAAAGEGLALLRHGDKIRVDLNTRRVDMLVPEEELEKRRSGLKCEIPPNQHHGTNLSESVGPLSGWLHGTSGVS